MNNRDTMPLVSIVVPVYGTEGYFNRCISSILRQSYQNLEIIIVNDGSPGNISEIMARYESDPRVVFIDNKINRGLLCARVCGAKAASGDYIAFVDSDDYVSDDFYRVLVNKALQEDADIVIGKTVWEKGDERYTYNYHEACFNFDQLVGDEIKKSYFGQETQCYSWHTIWNKIYKKKLWDICMPEYETVSEHIIMTEDIYFSSILFYNAYKVVHANTEAYFYCSNENASTNTEHVTYSKFQKNIHDISFVFDKVDNYLLTKQASESVLNCFNKGRSHYARMWRYFAENTFSDSEREAAVSLVNHFCSDYGEQKIENDYYFESVTTPWSGGLEYIKSVINQSKYKYISFDVFDTLIARPFYRPSDVFKLMSEEFSRKTSNSISFEKIRVEGEELARRYYGNTYAYEDITLKEIYEFISEHYGIKKALCFEIMDYECALEMKFCRTRNAGKELFDYAKAIGKRVVLTSDMYLSSEVIRQILIKNGIYGFEKLFVSCEERKLKYNGGLYQQVLSSLCVEKSSLLHIGDTWRSDIEGSSLVGIENVFFPKAIEVFENKIQGVSTNRCSNIGFSGSSGYRDRELLTQNLGYRCMIAMVANKYFDNPYRTFNAESDFNIDPYFLGYYPVGMHMLGLGKWLKKNYETGGYKQLVFLARDGALPMKTFSEYIQTDCEFRNSMDIQYLQASRKAILPILLKEKLNFYQLPIEYRAHSAMTLSRVLGFAVPKERLEEHNLHELMEMNGIKPGDSFKTVEQLHKYIDFYFKHLYDESKHREEISKVKDYYSRIREKSLAFDMGYSGRIQSAICEAAGKAVDVAYIHEDYNTSTEMKNHYQFNICDFYNYRPEISGLMRELIFSDTGGSCIRFMREQGDITEVFEDTNRTYPDVFVIKTIHSGAIDFVHEFVEFFGAYMNRLDYSWEDVSLPFEGFLRYPSAADMHMFSASYFEDMVYGAREEINVERFAMDHLATLGWPEIPCEIVQQEKVSTNPEDERITSLIHHSSQIKRGIIWMLIDWSFFVEKLKINFTRIKNRLERK